MLLYKLIQSEYKDELKENLPMMLELRRMKYIVHNEPVVCKSVKTSGGTSAHTAEYLQEVVMSAIILTEQRYSCKVGTFVKDTDTHSQNKQAC